MTTINAYTDYPIEELGDVLGEEAPIRRCVVVSYDGNKYCRVSVEGVETEFKAGYLYLVPGRVGDVPPLSKFVLQMLEHTKLSC